MNSADAHAHRVRLGAPGGGLTTCNVGRIHIDYGSEDGLTTPPRSGNERFEAVDLRRTERQPMAHSLQGACRHSEVEVGFRGRQPAMMRRLLPGKGNLQQIALY